MKMILVALLQTGIIFFIFCIFMLVTNKVCEKIWGKCKEDIVSKTIISFAYLFLAIAMWITIVNNLINRQGTMSNMQFFATLVIIGISCVVWCYFSWDLEQIFSMPCKATTEEKRLKKIVIYCLLGLFAILQGYHQTLKSLDVNYQIPSIFTAVNSSIVVAIIALDRVANQLFGERKNKEDKNMTIAEGRKNNIVKEKKKKTFSKVNHLRRIWILEKSKYLAVFLVIMFLNYMYLLLQMENLVPFNEMKIEYQVLSWYIIPLIMVLFDYWWNKDIRNGLWVRVMEQFTIKEDYKKFVAIKECIKTFEHIEGDQKKCDVITNVNVIEASIEYDKSQSIILPILATAFITVFFESEVMNFNFFILFILVTLIFLSLIELFFQLPKDAFIKKVITTIREEMKAECATISEGEN